MTQATHIRVAAPDGVELAVSVLSSAEENAGRVLVFLHGIGAYGGFYAEPLSALIGAVDAVYLPDLRGHGDSGPSPGRIGSPADVLGDIAAVVADARNRHPHAGLVLAGESMGGLFALAYAASPAADVDALVLLAPALRVAWLRQLTPATVRAALSEAGAKGWRVQGSWPDRLVRDHTFHERCVSDPRMLQRVSLSYLLTVARFQARWRSCAPRVGVPALVLHPGADALLDPRATSAIAKLLPRTTYVLVPDAWHNMLFDPRRDWVLDKVRGWLGVS